MLTILSKCVALISVVGTVSSIGITTNKHCDAWPNKTRNYANYFPQDKCKTTSRTNYDVNESNRDAGTKRLCTTYWDTINSFPAAPDNCKGFLTGHTGSIDSQEYWNITESQIRCLWIICADCDQVIRILWDVPDHHHVCDNTTQSDHLTVHSTDSFLDAKQNRWNMRQIFCLSNRPHSETIHTPLYFIEHVAGSLYHFNFKLKYWILNRQPACQYEFSGDFGHILSPDYPNMHMTVYPCIWKIIAPLGRRIQINLTDYASEREGCGYTSLVIRSCGEPTTILLNKICDKINRAEKILWSDTHMVWISYYSAVPNSGFQINWNGTFEGCGGERNKSSGMIALLDFSDATQRHRYAIECLWLIQVNPGSIVKLDFMNVDLGARDTKSCFCGRVEVYDGDISQPLAKSCGTSNFAPIFSSNNSMVIKIVLISSEPYGRCVDSISSGSSRSVILRYTATTNQVLIGDSGYIESFDFPNHYPENINVTWIIEASKGNTVQLHFLNFQLDGIGKERCSDYVQIHEWNRHGTNANRTAMGTFCGNNTPTVTPNSDTVCITMVTDGIGPGPRFRLFWEETGCRYKIHLDSEQSIVNISTPRYPLNYDNNIECHWLISTEYNMVVEFHLQFAEIEWNADCKFDMLDIHDGSDETSGRILHQCGKITAPNVITSFGRFLFVRFLSESTISYSGFTALLRQRKHVLSYHEYRSNTGHLYSPYWSGQFRYAYNCVWNITVQKHSVIDLNLEKFKVSTKWESMDRSCVCDEKIKIAYGDAEETLSYCEILLENNHMHRFAANTVIVKIWPLSSYCFAEGRFSIEFKAICNSDVTESAGILMSPPIIRGTGEYVNCSWRIIPQSPQGKILLLFTHIVWGFDKGNCKSEYVGVGVLNNENGSSTIYRDCCGRTPEPTLIGGGTVIVNVTGGHQVQAIFVNVPPECDRSAGKIVEDSSLGPDLNESCSWTIQSSLGRTIELHVRTYVPEQHTEVCGTGFITVHDGTSLNASTSPDIFCQGDIVINADWDKSIWIVYIRSLDQAYDGIDLEYVDTRKTTAGSRSPKQLEFLLLGNLIYLI